MQFANGKKGSESHDQPDRVEVEAAVRMQCKRGASQIKLALGGGVISDSDPIDTLQYTPEEIRAAVQAASDWGTYVCTHVYTVPGIRRAVDAGVRSIEHGHMADQPTLKLMADKGVWLSLQPFEAGDNPLTPEQIKKAEPTSHWDRVAAWAKTAGTRVAFGTDLLFQPEGTAHDSCRTHRAAQEGARYRKDEAGRFDLLPDRSSRLMASALDAQLAALTTMSSAQLRAEWSRVYRSASPTSPRLLRFSMREVRVLYRLRSRSTRPAAWDD